MKSTSKSAKKPVMKFFYFEPVGGGKMIQVLASTYKEAAQALANSTGSWVYDRAPCNHY